MANPASDTADASRNPRRSGDSQSGQGFTLDMGELHKDASVYLVEKREIRAIW
jgi:hypothetical protein